MNDARDQLELVAKALSERRRIDILHALCQCDCAQSVSDVCDRCSIDLSVVSRHLSQLREAGLVTVERQGRNAFYSADVRQVAALLRRLADLLEAPEGCCSVQTDSGSPRGESKNPKRPKKGNPT